MSKHIPLKWTDEESRYFSKPIKTAERYSDWGWWLVMAIGLSVVIWTCIQIWESYLGNLWLERI